MGLLDDIRSISLILIYYFPMLQIMEHPMNVLYVDLLQANMNLMNVLRGSSNKQNIDAVTAVNSAQVTSLWLILQNCANKLIDSSTGETP